VISPNLKCSYYRTPLPGRLTVKFHPSFDEHAPSASMKDRYFGFRGGWLTFWVTVACATDMTLFGYGGHCRQIVCTGSANVISMPRPGRLWRSHCYRRLLEHAWNRRQH